MATIQAKNSRGHKYWYIVESRRINGKPRPIVLAYLGKAGDLLKRLQGQFDLKLKSFSHGAVSALLKLADDLNIVELMNQYVQAQRPYMSSKPLRHQLTAGMTFLLASIGRVCMPTSKRGWYQWAKSTSLEYLLKTNLSKVDSQHFWDLMDCLPESNIPKIEEEVLQRIKKLYGLESDTLFFDTTNFYTYIHTTNIRCQIAQRGKNKQKRYDLRQVGLAMVVTRHDNIPVFHLTYQGSMNDSKVFADVIQQIKQRMVELNMDLQQHTVVFDRGNNSKKNLNTVRELNFHYIGALTPYHHQQLILDAEDHYQPIQVEDQTLNVFRHRREIWGEERTVLVFISRRLKEGQLRGIYTHLEKKKKTLQDLQKQLLNPKAKKRNRDQLEQKITTLLKGQYMDGLIQWSLQERSIGKFKLDFTVNQQKLNELENRLGFRIVMTNRHDWQSAEIIKGFYGQCTVEHVFKNIKNPYHLAVTPEFHWTDQKIRVHFFLCVLGFQLTSIIGRIIRRKLNYKGTLDNLLDSLNNIRLATILEDSKRTGKIKAHYKIEEMEDTERSLMSALGLLELHQKPPKIEGVGVYT